MIFTPDPLKRTLRILEEKAHQLLDAELKVIQWEAQRDSLRREVAYLRMLSDQLMEKQNAQNPSD